MSVVSWQNFGRKTIFLTCYHQSFVNKKKKKDDEDEIKLTSNLHFIPERCKEPNSYLGRPKLS